MEYNMSRLKKHKVKAEKEGGRTLRVPLIFIEHYMKDLTKNEIKLLLAFMSFTDMKTGKTTIRIGELAKMIGMMKNTVYTPLKGLINKGYVTTVDGSYSQKVERRVSFIPSSV